MGWTYAKFLLGNERASIAFIPHSTQLVARIKEIAAAEPTGGGGRLIDDPDFRAKLASLEIELDALRDELGAERVLSRMGLDDPSAHSDLSELRQLLQAWRDAKSSAWKAAVTWVVRGMLAVLLLGIAIRTGATGLLK